MPNPVYIRLDELPEGFREWAAEWLGFDVWRVGSLGWWHFATGPFNPAEAIPLHVPAGRAMVRGWADRVVAMKFHNGPAMLLDEHAAWRKAGEQLRSDQPGSIRAAVLWLAAR